MSKIEAKQAVSPVDLLKAAVTGTTEAKAATAEAVAEASPAKRLGLSWPPPIDLHRRAVPGAALALGVLLGGGVTVLTRSAPANDAVLALSTTLDAGRTETARIGSDIAQLHQVLADLRASTDAARKEAGARSGALGERLAQLDKSLNAKTAALGERFEQVEREQNARIAGLTAQLDRRAAAVPAARTEPAQTGSLAEAPRSADPKAVEARVPDSRGQEARAAETRGTETRAPETRATEAKFADAKPVDARPKPAVEKPPVIDGWALRDIFQGAAILENRRHRLVEVGPGDMLPGVGRVEAVERRGREWVVVTRQGLVTSQPW